MLNIYSLVKILSVVISAFSQILLKKSAMKHYENGIGEYLNWLVIIAYGMFFGSTILSIYSLKGISISLSTIIESMSYVFIPIMSYLFLKEKMNQRQFFGTIVIILGIIVYNI